MKIQDNLYIKEMDYIVQTYIDFHPDDVKSGLIPFNIRKSISERISQQIYDDLPIFKEYKDIVDLTLLTTISTKSFNFKEKKVELTFARFISNFHARVFISDKLSEADLQNSLFMIHELIYSRSRLAS